MFIVDYTRVFDKTCRCQTMMNVIPESHFDAAQCWVMPRLWANRTWTLGKTHAVSALVSAKLQSR